jgi:hypothetical protein
MYNSDTEVLFPSRVIPQLRSLHGGAWQGIIDRITAADSVPIERYAFVLMMVRMCGCVGCNADSFRAMRGCTQCARQTVRRIRGGDREVMDQFQQMQREVEAHLQKSRADSLSDKKDTKNQ